MFEAKITNSNQKIKITKEVLDELFKFDTFKRKCIEYNNFNSNEIEFLDYNIIKFMNIKFIYENEYITSIRESENDPLLYKDGKYFITSLADLKNIKNILMIFNKKYDKSIIQNIQYNSDKKEYEIKTDKKEINNHKKLTFEEFEKRYPLICDYENLYNIKLKAVENSKYLLYTCNSYELIKSCTFRFDNFSLKYNDNEISEIRFNDKIIFNNYYKFIVKTPLYDKLVEEIKKLDQLIEQEVKEENENIYKNFEKELTEAEKYL